MKSTSVNKIFSDYATMKVTSITSFKHIMQLFLQKKYEDCLQLIAFALKAECVDSVQLKIVQAGCWTYMGVKFKESIDQLREIIGKNPQNSFAHYGLGLSFYLNGDYKSSIAPFCRAFQLSPSKMERANIYKEQAEKMFKLFEDAKLELSSGNYKKGIELLSLLLLIDPENAAVQKRVKEMTDESLDNLVKELEIDVLADNNIDSKLMRAEFLIKSNKLEAAAKIMPAELPTSAFSYYVQGLLAYMKGSLKLSLVHFGKALELNAASIEAQTYSQKAARLVQLIEAASRQMSLKDNVAAIGLLTTALNVDVDNKRIVQAIYFQRAMCKLNLELRCDAFEDYMKFEALQNQTGMIMEGIKF